ncbi:helix-turn-helix domain-containing protein [Agrilactobacillus yilanensis]|uniref:Helix-turn-helix domain-containing protein n=1 Tax=Agrilactobacillus yilanensis TaxID=2485997 RepID=A0ABW4J922_9LACO|nr:helix-turn-helix transcriptional regulator [Agrilactobacillus yilanensis]
MYNNELKVKLPTDNGAAQLAIPKDITQKELQVFTGAIQDLMTRLGELNPELEIQSESKVEDQADDQQQIMITGDEVGGFVTSTADNRAEIAKKAGLFLRNYREKRSVQRMEISEQTGMSYSSVFNLEKGTSVPSVETLARFAEIYGCDVKIAFIKNDTYDEKLN